MKKFWVCLLISILLCGCSSMREMFATEHISSDILLPQLLAIKSTSNEKTPEIAPIEKPQRLPADKTINQYIQETTLDLVDNLRYVNALTPVGVTSFVFIDSDLNETSILGNQIAESFIHELHQLGIPVIDYKLTGWVQVTSRGDFAYSRDYEDLSDASAMEYMLTGTLVMHREGYLINSRIVGIHSKAVVASAQKFIPNSAANALIDRNEMSLKKERTKALREERLNALNKEKPSKLITLVQGK